MASRCSAPLPFSLGSGLPQHNVTLAHGICCRRKKPLPFVMNRYCVLVTSDGVNNPPFQFPHDSPKAGLN
jgi:hypothetical protein